MMVWSKSSKHDDQEKNIQSANKQQALLHQLFLFIYIYKPFS